MRILMIVIVISACTAADPSAPPLTPPGADVVVTGDSDPSGALDMSAAWDDQDAPSTCGLTLARPVRMLIDVSDVRVLMDITGREVWSSTTGTIRCSENACSAELSQTGHAASKPNVAAVRTMVLDITLGGAGGSIAGSGEIGFSEGTWSCRQRMKVTGQWHP